VTGSSTLLPITLEYAKKYPSQKFACLAGDVSLPNLAGANVRIYQGSYVAGMLAAMQPGVNKIGYVGAMYAPDSMRNVNAFALGARTVNPSSVILLQHTGSWYDPRAERIAGLRMFRLHGIDLLSYDSDSTELVKLASEEGKISMAKKSDGTALFGEDNLMSVIYVWNTIVVDLVSAAQDDAQWNARKDENMFVGFEKEAVSLGTYSSRVPASSRIAAKRVIKNFSMGIDPVWCPTGGKFHIICPRDNDIALPALGVAPTVIWPCNPTQIHAIPPSSSTCLNIAQQRNMTWLVEGIVHDLGLLKIPSECKVGTRMDALSQELCLPCDVGSFSDSIDQISCELCAPGFYNDAAGSSSCTVCPIGTFASQAGASSCNDWDNYAYVWNYLQPKE